MDGLTKVQGKISSKIDKVYREKGNTWPKILKYNYEKYGNRRRAMRHKHYGIWQPYTWEDYYLNVKYMALGLLSLGMAPSDKVLIIGDNAPQWYYAELAAQANRGVSVGLFSELTPTEIKCIAENCEAGFAVVESQEQIDKLLQIKDALPLLQKIIYWNYKGLAHYHEDILIGFREVLQRGRTYETEHPETFARNVEAGRANDLCAIIYTAGTTEAAPKGAVHSYQTLRAGADYLMQLDPWTEEDNVVPYLPPVWINEQWIGIGCHLLSACILNFAEAPETQQRDSRETGPSIVFYGARLWESKAAMVLARILGADALKRYAFRLLMPIGYRAAELKYRNQASGLFQKFLYFFANTFLFKSIKRSMGLLNAGICYTTGAVLSPDARKFYHALNLPLKGLYGSTEGGPLSCVCTEDIHLDTAGSASAVAEIKFSETGELIYRQAGTFLGYYKDPEKTAEVLKDGWFHSGDCCCLREDGHLVFVDRVNDLVELPDGDRLAPQLIESRLKFSPYIKDAWVLAGPETTYTVAIIIINYENVGKWAGQRKVPFTNFTELSQTPEAYGLVKQEIDRINQDLPPDVRVKKYVNFHKEFDPDESELTRTRNLIRPLLHERCRELIEAIYTGKEKVHLDARARYQDERMETTKTTLRIQSVEGATE